MMTRIILVIVLLGTRCEALPQPSPGVVPRFEDYPALASAPAKPAAAKFGPPSDAWPEGDPRFRSEVLRQESRGANFAGAFILVQVNCGSDCVYIAVADESTGAVYVRMPFYSLLNEPDLKRGSRSYWKGLEYTPDSRLLVAEGCFDMTAELGKGYCGRNYYEWKGNHFQLLKSVVLNAPRRASGRGKDR
jgi:hypothetical protein